MTWSTSIIKMRKRQKDQFCSRNLDFLLLKNLEIASQSTAGVAKLVDAPDLGSGAARRGGSSPSTRTKFDNIICFFLPMGSLSALLGSNVLSNLTNHSRCVTYKTAKLFSQLFMLRL